MTIGEYGEPRTEVHITEVGGPQPHQVNDRTWVMDPETRAGLQAEAQALLATFDDEPLPVNRAETTTRTENFRSYDALALAHANAARLNGRNAVGATVQRGPSASTAPFRNITF